MDLSDEEKLELTIDILKITQGMYKYTKCTCMFVEFRFFVQQLYIRLSIREKLMHFRKNPD